ncbi:PspC domain-containing protein [Tsukamurella tyrosinosolvens]|uniref:Phage shock protein PspC (Stress-responsive transcriptional regulator) n=2 Tax=Tsukamurella tyrosinosolvens TaxID=57704 RepID=A0A1H4ZHA4_TSUTY|nr:PspC domain-containing protein [Tsukamurella tyrosinosolvens]MCA4994513.1 PspC domain-containing protein [Tsukamurella tyrosinosolvens]WEL92532.1 PspC domain-containing protein [Tsukamurella tyrosinosolvens]SED29215.1 Phage shock protein PspC (stress-responsive transcriptional regulator) [Tsukamurella tyrosinosolvens]VEI01158.1 phage shock protein C [Tsukamurella tyrosinosolvens]
MDTTTLSSQLRQMWETRPLRARNAPIAGVCTGFARRYQVDVALVRAAFIGATVLGGLGFVAYIVGLFVLPKESEYAYGTPVQRSGPPTIVLIIAAVLAVTFGGGMSSSWPGAGFISLALLLAGWYALHQRLPVPPPGTAVSARLAPPAPVGAWQPPAAQFPWQPVWTPPAGTDPTTPQAAAPEQATEGPAGPSAQTPPAAAPSEPLNLQKAPAPEQAPRVQTQTTEEIHPPRWDPLGAAPFAWDLPEPAASNAPVPVEPKRRTRITPVTLGIALLTAAAIATVNLVLGVSISPVVAAAIVLGVVGTGLVAGAFRRGGYGLLAVAIPLAGFVIVGTMAQNVMSGFADAPRGDRNFTVADPNALQEQYILQAGSLKLDLRQLTLDHDRTLTTRVGLGETKIQVPEGMNVKVRCTVTVGDAQCPDGLNATPKPGAPTLTIDAQSNMGSVEVDRVR